MQLPSGFSHSALVFGTEALRLAARLAILAAIFVPLEQFFAVRRAKFFYAGWSTNLGWYFVNALTPALLLAPLASVLALGINAALPWRITHVAADMPFWGRAAAAMVLGEIGYYWGHRLSHEIPFLWRFHAVHHSAEHISFLVNTRAHPVDMVFGRLCMLVPLCAFGLAAPLGPNASLPTLVLVFGLTWSFVIHANIRLRLGWLEQLIATPAFHHWHHTRNDHQDHNYATMLPFVDRLFGTFYLPRHWPAEYGTDTPMPNTVSGQLLEPFAPAATVRPASAAPLVPASSP